MKAGTLDRRIRIEYQATAADTYGEPIVTWTVLDTVWAAVTPARGDERFTEDQITATRTLKFRIRYRSDVTETMRIVHDGLHYDITEVLELGRREGLDITAYSYTPEAAS